jgi:hypothetical protein
VLFSFNLLLEFHRAIDPKLKTYKQPATLRFEVFTCGAILGRSGYYLVLHISKELHISKDWDGYSQRNRSSTTSYIDLPHLPRSSIRHREPKFRNWAAKLTKFMLHSGTCFLAKWCIGTGYLLLSCLPTRSRS